MKKLKVKKIKSVIRKYPLTKDINIIDLIPIIISRIQKRFTTIYCVKTIKVIFQFSERDFRVMKPFISWNNIIIHCVDGNTSSTGYEQYIQSGSIKKFNVHNIEFYCKPNRVYYDNAEHKFAFVNPVTKIEIDINGTRYNLRDFEYANLMEELIYETSKKN